MLKTAHCFFYYVLVKAHWLNGDDNMASNYLEERAKKYVGEAHAYHEAHNFLWFSQEVGEEYKKRALALGCNTSDVGARRQLRIELQEKYGLTEVEALNVLNGFHITEYANKYKRIKNMIPTEIIRYYEPEENSEGDYRYDM